MPVFRAIIRAGFAVAILGVFGVIAFAQDKVPAAEAPRTAEPRVKGQGHEGMRGRGHRGSRRGAALRQLNLSDMQRQQMQETFTKFREGIRPQVEELRQIRQKFEQANASIDDQTRAQALRQQIRASREQARAQAQAFLTPEQQEQLRQMREQKKLRREEMRQRRGAERGQQTPAIQ